jgi:tRNA pseudouridine55 synthase
LFGIILINKPLEMTSHDVVGILRKRFNTKRIGHAGTLDPMATGLLVLAVGPATRFLHYLPLEPKVYVAKIEFGKSTNSFDQEGEITEEHPVPDDLHDQLANVLPTMIGFQEQLPPMFSAVKVKGQPLYKYARMGEEIERKTRRIFISRLDVLETTHNTVTLEIECSGGTYVRTIAHDLGQKIGCGAYLAGLVRTKVGRFSVEGTSGPKDETLSPLITLREALAPMEERQLSELEYARVQNGGHIANSGSEAEFVTLISPNNEVVSVAAVDGNLLRPQCVIPIESLHNEEL